MNDRELFWSTPSLSEGHTSFREYLLIVFTQGTLNCTKDFKNGFLRNHFFFRHSLLISNVAF